MNTALLAALSLPNLITRIPGGVAQGIIWGIMALGSLHLQSMMRHIRTDGIRFGMILAASSTSAVIVMISGFGTTISIMLKSKI